MTDRAVAIVARAQGRCVLAFRYPLRGLQLVKGRLRRGETHCAAALREQHEESGLAGVKAWRLGALAGVVPGQRWHLVQSHVPAAPDRWAHASADDGGRVFRFFWHRLDAHAGGFAIPYRRVLARLPALVAGVDA